MNRQLLCPNNKESLYDEVLHEIDNNILSIKLPKDRHRIQAVDGKAVEPIIDVNCLDKYGKIRIICYIYVLIIIIIYLNVI